MGSAFRRRSPCGPLGPIRPSRPDRQGETSLDAPLGDGRLSERLGGLTRIASGRPPAIPTGIGLRLTERISKVRTSEPGGFILDPIHRMPGLDTCSRNGAGS